MGSLLPSKDRPSGRSLRASQSADCTSCTTEEGVVSGRLYVGAEGENKGGDGEGGWRTGRYKRYKESRSGERCLPDGNRVVEKPLRDIEAQEHMRDGLPRRSDRNGEDAGS